MKTLKPLSLLLCFLIMGILLSCATSTPDLDLLWTTDSAGTAEIDEFFPGTPVYLRTNPALTRPLPPSSTYKIYIFLGNIVPVDGMVIPDDFGTSLIDPPPTVITDNNGQFGPIKIWDIPNDPTLIGNDYTIILDCTRYGGGPTYDVGEYNEACPCDCTGDYRDDLTTTLPVPPSFHIIPETVLGTLSTLISMFTGFGYFLLRKKR